MDSPCVKVCQVDPAGQRCIACGRTLAEIGAWTHLTDEQRRAIMARLEASKKAAS